MYERSEHVTAVMDRLTHSQVKDKGFPCDAEQQQLRKKVEVLMKCAGDSEDWEKLDYYAKLDRRYTTAEASGISAIETKMRRLGYGP